MIPSSLSAFLLILICIIPTLPIINAEVYQVTVDSVFTPNLLCIHAGDFVQWIFQNPGHSVEETVGVGSCVSKQTWYGYSARPKWTWSHQFNEAGVVSYMSNVGTDCGDGMTGVIYVGDCPSNVTATSTAIAKPTNTTTSKNPNNSAASISSSSMSVVNVIQVSIVVLALVVLGEIL